jgi:hypothetical protein
MKKMIFLLLLLFSFLSFAQTAESEYRSSSRGNFGRTFEERVKRSEDVLAKAERLADEKGISVKKITLKNREGRNYPALQIIPQGSSAQNREAARVGREMSALPLVLSPFDLSSGSAAFFDPNGSKLGVPYEFLLDDGINHSSYLHELYHAGTYQKVLSRRNAPWAGLTRVLNGTYLSTKNTQYYFRFGAVDELVATSLSLKHEVARLIELERTLSSFDFYRSRGEADQLLNSIYQSVLVGKFLSRQTVDLADRALAAISKVQHKAMTLTLGRTSRSITESVFMLDSYNWEIVGGRGTHVAVSEGSYFSLYSATRPTDAALRTRLGELKSLALRSEGLYQEIEKKIYVLIEYPDLKKTDLKGLEALSSGPFHLLDR